MSARAATNAVGRRRDTKAEIAAAATRLFRDLGYHRVGIDDVAEAVGITGGAIYRHFANKGELLARTLFEGLDEALTAVEASTPGNGEADDVPAVVARLAALALDRRGFGLLLQREARHLGLDEQAELRRRADAVTSRLATLTRAVRADLDADDASLLAQSALSGLASPSFHAVVLGRDRADTLLRTMAMTVLESAALPSPAPTSPPSSEPARGNGRHRSRQHSTARSSRREMLLAASIQLFGSRGYWPVRMEDIGAAAGITGPSIYQYFPGKADLLVAALNRGAEWLQLGMSGALGSSSTPSEALDQVLGSYVRFVLEHTDLMSLLLTEAVYLPDPERHVLRRTQHDYVGEWATLLLEVRPELTDADALFLTHCVLAIVNDGGRRAHIRDRADGEQVLIGLGRDVLGLAAAGSVGS